MTESKSQDKYFPYSLKQEGYDTSFMNWVPVDGEFEEFRNSNSHFIGRMNNRGQLFENFAPLPMNPDLNNESISMANQSNNIDAINDQNDQSARMNSSFPLFNEKLLASNNAPSEVSINQMKSSPYTSLMMNNMNMSKHQNFQPPNAFYFPFSNNNIRRPLPQELLEEEPVYVNPKQYERIMKLRIKKVQKGMLKNSVMPVERPKDINSYKHLSRHLHAKRRDRGAGGRFLSKEAQEAQKRKEMEEGGGEGEEEGLGFGNLAAQAGFGHKNLQGNE